MNGKNPRVPARHPLTDLLIEDLKHFGESLWRNDEIGEKRFNFFLTLVTAVIVGLVTLLTAKDVGTDVAALRKLIACGAVWALFGLGLLTYVCLLLRNRVMYQYHLTLKYIRGQLVSLYPNAPVDDYEVPRKLDSTRFDWIWRRLKVGLAGTSGTMTGALLFVA